METTILEQVLDQQVKLLEAIRSGELDPNIMPYKSKGGVDSPRHMTRHGDVAALSAQNQGPLNELGFFQDCQLEACIVNTTIQPAHSFFNFLPVKPSVQAERKIGFITGISGDDTGTLPNDPCDPPQTINDDIAACKMRYPYGRHSGRTKTMEIDELIERACREGNFDDFFFLGDHRGVSVDPTQNDINSRDLLTTAAVRYQMSLLGRSKQRWSISKLWTGDPANSTANGGYREHIGLLNLITDDWDTNLVLAPYLESLSSDCSSLNSDVKLFDACLGATNADGYGIYQMLQELEDTLYHRAFRMGLLPAEWVLVMPSTHWSELIKVIPCEMVADGCSGGVTNANDGGSGMFNMAMREQMRSSMKITLNGRSYPVLIDDGIPNVFTAGPPVEYESSIFFIPVRAGGEDVLYIDHKDYRRINQELSPIPGSATDLRGWTDRGRHHFLVNRVNWCFEVWSKMEWRLIFKAPHLAGRIDGVKACPIQAKDLPTL